MKRPDTLPKVNTYRLPDSDRYVPYDVYRDTTGLCETCGEKVAGHDKCEGCGILCGLGHLDYLPTKYRGHKLCGYCRMAWPRLEERLGHPASWEQFTNPTRNKPQ